MHIFRGKYAKESRGFVYANPQSPVKKTGENKTIKMFMCFLRKKTEWKLTADSLLSAVKKIEKAFAYKHFAEDNYFFLLGV